jgi:pimeloyl-ACP methyl ester carboxylesterase
LANRRNTPAGWTGAAAAWLQNLIAQTCAEATVVVGHSVGGALALHLAIQHRSSVGRIVLVGCSSLGRFRPAPALVVALVRYGARPSPASRDRFLRQVLADPERARTEWGARWAALEAYDLDQATRPNVDAVNRQLVLRIGARRIAPDKLRRIGVPVALIWGRADKLMRFRIAEKASEQFGWPLYPIDDCGHGPHIERPEAFVEALKSATAAT